MNLLIMGVVTLVILGTLLFTSRSRSRAKLISQAELIHRLKKLS